MTTSKILVVDDDRDIAEILCFNLRSEGYDVEAIYSAESALELLEHYAANLILLDVMMGEMSGYRFAEELRRQGNNVPIIFLTARDAENDMLTAFSVGGDDYISKPFSIKEVVARVRALMRRAMLEPIKNEEPLITTIGALRINKATKEVLLNGEAVALTKTEYELLLLLASNTDRLFTREEIIETVWSETPYITERTVDVHLTRLRKKLGAFGACITNRAGYGYRFKPDLL